MGTESKFNELDAHQCRVTSSQGEYEITPRGESVLQWQ
jgi:hypothetical protein